MSAIKPVCSPHPINFPHREISRSRIANLKTTSQLTKLFQCLQTLFLESAGKVLTGVVQTNNRMLFYYPANTATHRVQVTPIQVVCALLIIIVFTFGISTPLSTILVETNTSYFLSIKSSRRSSKFVITFHLAVGIRVAAGRSGQRLRYQYSHFLLA